MTPKRRAALDATAAAMRAASSARKAGGAPGADGWLVVLLLRRELAAANRTIALLRLEVDLLRAQLPEARKRTGG